MVSAAWLALHGSAGGAPPAGGTRALPAADRPRPAQGARPPARSRVYEAVSSAAASWAQPWRVMGKPAVLAAGDHPRFGGTSRAAPTPPRVYAARYGARGHGGNDQGGPGCLPSDRTSATPCLADAMRLVLACAASVLHHALRTHPLGPPPGRGATLHAAPPPLHSGDAGPTVQGPDFPPPAAVLASQSALGSGPRAALRRPVPALHTSCDAIGHRPRAAAPRLPGARRRHVEVIPGDAREEVETPLRRRGACSGGSRAPLAFSDDTLECVSPLKIPLSTLAQELDFPQTIQHACL